MSIMLKKMKYISKLYTNYRLLLNKKSLLNFIKEESGIIGYLNPYTFNILDLEKIYRNINFKFVFETITSPTTKKILNRKVDSLNIDFTGVAADVFKDLKRLKYQLYLLVEQRKILKNLSLKSINFILIC